ncbi:hypothetical protein LXA43DRAFT_1096540 [Ganoderma leucocontextum]|nr:hypothetical protein LXA43DRAFT_1096540 [Ganoderma leucocontextum]
MGCYNQLLPRQKPQIQPLQQLVEPPRALWQPCPPQVIFNPWMASQYPPMGWMPPQLQLLPPGPTEESPWFQALVSDVSRKIKEVETKADARDVDERKAVSTDLPVSAKDEKALRDALKKGEEDGLMVQEVFEELSKTHGDKKIEVWTKWFVANFEKLYTKVFSNANSPHVDATANNQIARVGPKRQPVTEDDLRAMALYRLEKGDDCETRRYSRPCWHEFAQRPQNLKRSLEAWVNIPRAHSAAIDRYVKEYQKEAAQSKMTLGASSSAERLPAGGKTSQKRGVDPANAGGDSGATGGGADQPPLKRKKTSLAVDPEDITDLTVETEEYKG